ncbi:GNAT family N-acetyltransferase [Candidatus Hydrogenedentota bacterium]
MNTIFRHYNHEADYDRVAQFLVKTYRTTGDHINWLQPRWEYMHRCSTIKNVNLGLIGVWEAQGKIVGVIHPEDQMGTVYVEVDPDYAFLKREMLVYAQQHLYHVTDGVRQLRVYINDRDMDFQSMAAEMEYGKTDSSASMSRFPISHPFPAISLPDGFTLQDLEEEYDLEELAVAVWRGFDHVDDPPEDNIECWKFRQEAPNYRHDLHIVVRGPDGYVASYCGMWYEPLNRIAYVEPVCTVPEGRRMGLGSAAVLEGIRRCGKEGATVAYVGSATRFYQSMGFRRVYDCSVWQREWT